jgi:hypothetical protein
MRKEKEGQFSKKLGMTRCKGKRIKGRKFLRNPFSEITPRQINKVKQPKMRKIMQIHLEKGQGSNLFNVGDVR